MGIALSIAALPATALASSAPVIESESATHVESTDATLEAKINPAGRYTGYDFVIYTTPSADGDYSFTQNCVFDIPGYDGCAEYVSIPPPGVRESGARYIPAGSGEQTVSLDLASIGVRLEPGSTYHFKVIATNTDNYQGLVKGPEETFTTPAAGSPVIESLSASNVTQNDATLEAQINPEGLETTYELWMEDPCKPPMECIGVPQLLTGSIPAGTSSESFSIDLQSSGKHLNIEPGMTYGYSVIAKNANGTVEEHRVFKTLAANTPKVDSESVSNITPTDATLQAQIDTEGLQTSYQFQLSSICGGKGACLIMISYPLPSGLLLGSFIDQSVSLDLTTAGVTLQPGGTYTYSVSATNASGTTESPPHSFTTPENVVHPLSTSATTSPPSAAGQLLGSSGGDPSAGSGGSSSSAPGTKPLVAPLGKSITPKVLTNAQKLEKALKRCEKKPTTQRPSCKRQAEKKYAATSKHRP